MRIAQVAPLEESVPPEAYGGTERVVHGLTEALVELGHEVTLFASGDSRTRARLVPGSPRALRRSGVADHLPHQLLQLEEVFAREDAFDVVHFHVDYLHYPLSARHGLTHLTTLHGRLDLPELVPLYRRFPDVPVVSISDAQRAPLPWIGWRATVHHGLQAEDYPFRPDHEGYLAFVGRVSPEKRLDRAIRIARHLGLPLKIGAKVDEKDAPYFQERVAPLLDQPGVEFLGEVDQATKVALLGGAAALLFPIDWPEPFGLVMIEALACGTPVLAYRHGAVPEVLEDGISGFVVDDFDGALEAAERIPELRRAACRAAFERRFTVERMAADYVRVYEGLLSERPRPLPRPRPWPRPAMPLRPTAGL